MQFELDDNVLFYLKQVRRLESQLGSVNAKGSWYRKWACEVNGPVSGGKSAASSAVQIPYNNSHVIQQTEPHDTEAARQWDLCLENQCPLQRKQGRLGTGRRAHTK